MKRYDTDRIFCAVEIPERVGALAVKHVNTLQKEFPHVAASWNRDGRFHLTCKFLDFIPPNRVADVSQAADLAAQGYPQFQINIAGASVFAKHGPPRVLWLGVEDAAGNLLRLQLRLEEECSRRGFERESRPFHPHLTLARVRKPEGAMELGIAHRQLGFKPVPMTVSELLVMRSELNPKGSRYSVISKHPFN